MSITRFHTNARMSQAVVHNGVVYLAGQVAADADADVAGQTRSVLERIDALLAEVGTDKNRLLSATIILRDVDNGYGPMNEVWDAWVPEGQAPARACIEAHLASPKLLVEICIVAAVD
jgi:enamine deaminase RidA (YjgF/YER057c/UK114 family)